MSAELAKQARPFLEEAGYDSEHLVSNYAFTSRLDDGSLVNDRADLVAFGGAPHTMRTACVSVVDPATTNVADTVSKLRFLTAPLAIVGTGPSVDLWSIRRGLQPKPFKTAPREKWQEAFRGRLANLSPESILEAKRGDIQLPFVDAELGSWAERVTGDALTKLLESLLAHALKELSRGYSAKPAAHKAIVRLVFNLFTCRILEDLDVIEKATDPACSLRSAKKQFSENIDPDVVDSPYLSKSLIGEVHSTLRERFAFASLTTDMLGHAYENALVSAKLRKEHGIYYTPHSITSYILRRLPIESIPQDDRHLLDPCCGSGSFLLAGFERLASLLPDSWTPAQRHQYLRARIVGRDIDDFAREIASLSLVLADVHNRNGWKVRDGDVREITVEAVGRRPTIVVTNPPFKEIKEAGTRSEFAADTLVRLIDLTANDGLIGIVLPQSMLDSRAGAAARAAVLNYCDTLELSTFPGGVFYSHADSVALLLRKRSARTGRRERAGVVTVQELRSRDLAAFNSKGIFTRTYSVDTADWVTDSDNRFIVSPLLDTWKKLEASCGRLGRVADIRSGLQIKKEDVDSATDQKRRGDVSFVDRLNVLRPFALLTTSGLRQTRWLRYGDQLRRPCDRDIFDVAKVLVNSNRNPGSTWRLVAAVAPEGLFFSHNFHGVIPKPDSAVSIEQIVAVLNSPVANAWFDAHCRKRWIVLTTLGKLPFPTFDGPASLRVAAAVGGLEKAIISKWKEAEEGLFYDGLIETADTALLLGEIDSLVYDAYGLTKVERREIDKLMSRDRRPS
ncbi:MAG: N-6 DNA methylase [Phycisphaerae bacterium]